ncbi:MAG: hypothetical protein A2W91_07620 [Bacteroidetes bacterium GWF2_38_335]|nr:MAG: hypothetical protein A2W91_07620 [Bacteroidetes bacterium GWF2_38_335]OFY79072.1 MAG: hypothetical protein A2281_03100 [Bacteroidetes bacterium RIFOXYA12_FULL_38_20]HBS86158.1 hypothetical protein [Bacteroidales bacterium]
MYKLILIVLAVVFLVSCGGREDELKGYWQGSYIQVKGEDAKIPFNVIFNFMNKRFKMRVYSDFPKQKIYNSPGTWKIEDDLLILEFSKEKIDTHNIMVMCPDSLVLNPLNSDITIVLKPMKKYRMAKMIEEVSRYLKKMPVNVSRKGQKEFSCEFRDNLMINLTDQSAGSWTLDTVNEELFLLFAGEKRRLFHVSNFGEFLTLMEENAQEIRYDLMLSPANEDLKKYDLSGIWKGNGVRVEIADTLFCVKSTSDTMIFRWEYNSTADFLLINDLFTGKPRTMYRIDSISDSFMKLFSYELNSNLELSKEKK